MLFKNRKKGVKNELIKLLLIIPYELEKPDI